MTSGCVASNLRIKALENSMGAINGSAIDPEFKYVNTVTLNSQKYVAFEIYLDEAETEAYKLTVSFDYSGSGQHLCMSFGRQCTFRFYGLHAQVSTSANNLQSVPDTSFNQIYRSGAAIEDLKMFSSDLSQRNITGTISVSGYGGSDNFYCSIYTEQVREDSDEYVIFADLRYVKKQS